MPSKTAPTREQIEKAAAAIEAQLDAFRQQDQQRADEERQRRHDAQRKWDEQFVANYSYTQTELAVGEARRALDEALADDPTVVAMVAYQAALRRRYRLLMERNDALTRLGHTVPPLPSMVTELHGLEDMVFHLVERIGSEQVTAEIAELHARRDAAGTNTAEEDR